MIEQNTENTSRIGLSCCIIGKLIAVDDKVCTARSMAGKDILEFVLSLKNITNADSDDENEMNNCSCVCVSSSSEMRNVVKSRRSYLGVYSNGEISNKMDDIEQFVEI
ncbi:hypothetical protein TNCV_89891 [Trichonephila clavipes]|nr:hypothetical protein TNCV_89891 [Trichonephila clavipes]